MSWIEITTDDVQRKLAGAELTALKTKALSAGQEDPLPDIISDVVGEIRGYVAACASNRLGSGATIPEKLKSAALAMIRFRLATRLPVASLLTDDRRKENSDALSLMRDVAGCRFAIEEPDEVSTEVIGAPMPKFGKRCRNFTRRTQDGI